MAAAVLSYGIVYFWIELTSFYNLPWILAYVLYYLASLIPSYLVCKRTGAEELSVAIRCAVFSWALVVISLLAFTEGNTIFFFAVLLVVFIIGGATSAYITLRKSLKTGKQSDVGSLDSNALNQP